jgi:hypothetical protein
VQLQINGLTLTVDDTGRLGVRPADRLTDELRELIRTHREELASIVVAGVGDGFDPRQFPETIALMGEFRQVFGAGCRLLFATEGDHTFGTPTPEGVPASIDHRKAQERAATRAGPLPSTAPRRVAKAR